MMIKTTLMKMQIETESLDAMSDSEIRKIRTEC